MLTKNERRDVLADLKANVVGRIAELRPGICKVRVEPREYVVTGVDEDFALMWGHRVDGTTSEAVEPHIFPVFGDGRWTVAHSRDATADASDLIRNLGDLIRQSDSEHEREQAGYTRQTLVNIVHKAATTKLATELGVPINTLQHAARHA